MRARTFWWWHLLLVPVLLLNQNCSRASFHDSTVAPPPDSSPENSSGNDFGYGGKVLVAAGTCSDGTPGIVGKMQLASDAKSALLTINDCTPVHREITDFRVLATGDAVLFESRVYVATAQTSPTLVDVKQITLSAFVQGQAIHSIRRQLNTTEESYFVDGYDPSTDRACHFIASTLIRGQDSMTMQEAMVPADRAAFVIRALLDRDGSASEIANWTERTGFTWQQIYDDIMATPEFRGRCGSYGLVY